MTGVERLELRWKWAAHPHLGIGADSCHTLEIFRRSSGQDKVYNMHIATCQPMGRYSGEKFSSISQAEGENY